MQQGLQPARLGLGLDDGTAICSLSGEGEALAVEVDFGLAFGRLALGFGFDGENAGGADEDVVDVEALADQVMKHLVAFDSEFFQVLADGPLAGFALAQGVEFGPDFDNPINKEGERNQAKHAPNPERNCTAIPGFHCTDQCQ